MKKIKKIKYSDFKIFFKQKNFSKKIKKDINSMNLEYVTLSFSENKEILNKITQAIKSKKIKKSGKKYKDRWNQGWKENFLLLKKNSPNSIRPKYFGKYNYARINSKIYKTKNKFFDFKILKLILSIIFEKYFSLPEQIIEFGCGTGHNLIQLKKTNKDAELYGLDWSIYSQKILKLISKKKNENINGYHFDYFNPKIDFKLDKVWSCYTVASLEQTGTKYKKFLNMLLRKKPRIVVNLEPVPELLNKKNLYDKLSIKYMYKRNYLRNYYTYLKKIEKEKKIKILFSSKSYFGSLYINGYSLIVWKPL